MTDDQSTVVLSFAQSRATGGEDVAALIRGQLPDADIRAELDEQGAVSGYSLTLYFPDADAAAGAAFHLRDFFAESGIPVEFG